MSLLLATTLCLTVPPTTDWAMDVLILKNGRRMTGLYVRETAATIHFHNVRRRPGRPTVVIAATFDRSEVERIEKISPEERQLLEARLRELDPTGEQEQERMGRLELERVAWEGKPAGALRYRSDAFSLISPAPEAVVRQAAVRLEQIFSAYADYLPPRVASGPTTEIILLSSLADYRRRLQAEGRPFLNPAFYDPANHRIVCASDIEQLGTEYELIRKRHYEMYLTGRKEEAALRKRFGPRDLPRYLNPILEERRQIQHANAANAAIIDRAADQLYRSLYHEAFHAYVAGHVYPEVHGALPRWLNEGLAQVFETALVEAGELRVGHADRDRLDRAKALLRKGELLPLADVLTDDPKRFLVAHAGDRFGSDRAYVTCWAVAFYLAFERRKLGTPELERYVAELHAGRDRETAFVRLVGQPLMVFEQELHRYLTRLQPDGTAADFMSASP